MPNETCPLEPVRTIPPVDATKSPGFATATKCPDPDVTQIHAADTMEPVVSAVPVIPGFVLREVIGSGGMGVVWQAFDEDFRRDVAVKLLRDDFPADGLAAERFFEEARITGQLQHPGIPAVYRIGQIANGRPFLAMKLIRGQTLAQLLDAKSPVNVSAVFEQICQAVGYAHAHGVIHRDLKPANIMVGAFGVVQVMDWGLAKLLSNEDSATVPARESQSATMTRMDSPRPSDYETQPGSAMGTPAYMPPEQAIGAVNKLGTASDVFGLGATLCHMLTGRAPYHGADAESTRQLAAQAKLDNAFTALDTCGAEPALVVLCQQCLAADPLDRPVDGSSVARRVAEIRNDYEERVRTAERDKQTAEVRVAEQVKRRRVIQRATGAVVAVLLAGVIGTTAGLYRADAARQDAQKAQQMADARREEAERARREEQLQRQMAVSNAGEANAVVQFFEDYVFAAARPRGQAGGLGSDVTLRAAITAGLPVLDKSFAAQPLAEARLRMTVALSLRYLGESAAAVEQDERARDLYRRHRGPDHADTLRSEINLANSYAAQGRHGEAIRLHEQVLAAAQRTLPPDHPDTLRCLTNLALSYSAVGRNDDALVLDEQALAANRRIHPPDHADTLRAMNNAAVSYDALRRYDEALQLREATLAAYRRTLPPDHPDTLRAMNNLAISYAHRQRDVEVLRIREEVFAACQRVFPPDHPDTLRAMMNLALSYTAGNRMADALRLDEQALASYRRTHPPDHPATIRCMHNLGVDYSTLGRHAEALAIQLQTLEAYSRLYPLDHPDRLKNLWAVAESLCRLDRAAEAIPHIDTFVKNSRGPASKGPLLPKAVDLRLRYYQTRGDASGCRATAQLWDGLNRDDADSLYNGACNWAVAASLKNAVPDDADRAMLGLTKAVAAGYKDRHNMEIDADLNSLRMRDDFQKLLTAVPLPPRPGP